MTDVFQRLTDKIVSDLENGELAWRKPWSKGVSKFPLRSTGEEYRGVNVIILQIESMAKGYSSPYWMTYKQAKTLGAQVKKGSKGTPVAYYNKVVKEGEDGDRKYYGFLKSYTVFNVEQIEGLGEEWYPEPEKQISPLERIQRAEKFFGDLGGEVEYGKPHAAYLPAIDKIQMPDFETFNSPESFYATLGHEYVHWTGHKSRCNRELSQEKEKYAFEELVAELGSVFLCSYLGISLEPTQNNVAYVKSWLKALKGDKRLVFKAASKAQRSFDYLTGEI